MIKGGSDAAHRIATQPLRRPDESGDPRPRFRRNGTCGSCGVGTVKHRYDAAETCHRRDGYGINHLGPLDAKLRQRPGENGIHSEGLRGLNILTNPARVSSSADEAVES